MCERRHEKRMRFSMPFNRRRSTFYVLFYEHMPNFVWRKRKLWTKDRRPRCSSLVKTHPMVFDWCIPEIWFVMLIYRCKNKRDSRCIRQRGRRAAATRRFMCRMRFIVEWPTTSRGIVQFLSKRRETGGTRISETILPNIGSCRYPWLGSRKVNYPRGTIGLKIVLSLRLPTARNYRFGAINHVKLISRWAWKCIFHPGPVTASAGCFFTNRLMSRRATCSNNKYITITYRFLPLFTTH